ncbi:hypothetical protein KST_04526 [Mycobacterium marinum]|nr:hypothetical protein KST_04526 [Mycobacterium marinum]
MAPAESGPFSVGPVARAAWQVYSAPAVPAVRAEAARAAGPGAVEALDCSGRVAMAAPAGSAW